MHQVRAVTSHDFNSFNVIQIQLRHISACTQQFAHWTRKSHAYYCQLILASSSPANMLVYKHHSFFCKLYHVCLNAAESNADDVSDVAGTDIYWSCPCQARCCSARSQLHLYSNFLVCAALIFLAIPSLASEYATALSKTCLKSCCTHQLGKSGRSFVAVATARIIPPYPS